MFWITTLILILFPYIAFAGHVNGYYRSNGTYVQSYERSDPNSTVTDNYSYKGNVNPYTGETGTNYYRNNTTSAYYNSNYSNTNNSSPLQPISMNEPMRIKSIDFACVNRCTQAGSLYNYCQQACSY